MLQNTHHRSSFSKPQPSLCRNQSSCQPISDKEGDAACRRTGIKSRRETCCGESAGNFPELRSCGGGGKMDGGIMRRRRRKRLRKLLASKFVFSPGEGRRQIVRGGPARIYYVVICRDGDELRHSSNQDRGRLSILEPNISKPKPK